ncbi:hypothetical protein F7725_006021 [Dissostichus mawsoni]|uniref:Uncharacterized protein n=1 Tax=Dissostichus mawsoni TaxID=36200 RepID=A0A7J5YT60_DISMA|nr:hypothetical protein F7725_006021 [Dissostichus mawsoni]
MCYQPVAPVNRGEAPSSTRPAVQMSGFDLLPVDGGGGEPIHLPPGETVLGRGPLLGVSDKRVSRLHGLLENLNGRLRLKPTHLNPCFVQSLLSDDPRPLQRDVWFPLQDGDLFSLMPEEEEEEERIVSPEPDVEPPPAVGQTFPQEESTPTAPSEQQEADKRSLTKVDSAQPKEEEDKQNVISPSVTRTRRSKGPSTSTKGPSTSTKGPSTNTKGPSTSTKGPSTSTKGPSTSTKGPSTSTKGPSTSTKAAEQATPTKTSSPEEELSEEEMPKKRRRKMSDEEQEATQSKTDVPSEQPSGRLQSESNRSGISDESDGFPMEEEEEERGAGTSAATPTHRRNEEKKMKNGRQQTKRADARLRTPCPYGKLLQ